MAIQKKPASVAGKTAAADVFVSGAPDAAKAPPAVYDKGLPKGNKRQISITIAPDLLRRLDEKADAMGTGRSAFISMAIFRALED